MRWGVRLHLIMCWDVRLHLIMCWGVHSHVTNRRGVFPFFKWVGHLALPPHPGLLSWYLIVISCLVLIGSKSAKIRPMASDIQHYNDVIMIAMAFQITSLTIVYSTVINWKHFPRYWPFVGEIHRWIPLAKASDAGLWNLLWSTPWLNG